MTVTRKPTNAPWMSVSSSEVKTPPGSLSISVVMKPGLGSQYAGIRLVLVWVGVPQEVRYLRQCGLHEPFSLLNVHNVRNRHQLRSQLPLFTVVLGLEFKTDERNVYYSVAPMSEATAPRSTVYNSRNPPKPEPIGTLCDFGIPWKTPAFHGSDTYSANISFACTPLGYGVWRPSPWNKGKAITVLVLNQAMADETRRSPSLPPEIILRIGRYLTKASHILSAALVTKSWFPLMRAFFQKLGWSEECFVHSLDNFAEAVKLHSADWGSQVTALDIRHHRVVEIPRFYVRSFGDIISYAPNLRVLIINLLVLTWARDSISKLAHLEELVCSPYGMRGQTPTRLPSIEDIQQMVSTVSGLRRLSLSGVGRSKPCEVEAPSKSPQFQLLRLEIHQEHISSAQLEYFMSCPNQLPRLRVLDLEKVGGFSPSSLSKFLFEVAPTLCSLRIVECDAGVIRSEDEKSVLDEAIERMHSLRKLELNGRVLTPTAISFSSHPKGELRVCTKGDLTTEDGLDMMEMIQCYEVGWSKLVICIIAELINVNLRKEATEVAKRKGFKIIFRCISPFRPPH